MRRMLAVTVATIAMIFATTGVALAAQPAQPITGCANTEILSNVANITGGTYVSGFAYCVVPGHSVAVLELTADCMYHEVGRRVTDGPLNQYIPVVPAPSFSPVVQAVLVDLDNATFPSRYVGAGMPGRVLSKFIRIR